MKAHSQNQRILCAYALLLTVAAGAGFLDPVQRQAASLHADVPIPTPKVFKITAAPDLDPNAPGADRLAKQ